MKERTAVTCELEIPASDHDDDQIIVHNKDCDVFRAQTGIPPSLWGDGVTRSTLTQVTLVAATLFTFASNPKTQTRHIPSQNPLLMTFLFLQAKECESIGTLGDACGSRSEKEGTGSQVFADELAGRNPFQRALQMNQSHCARMKTVLRVC
jgi:hypothetical protein